MNFGGSTTHQATGPESSSQEQGNSKQKINNTEFYQILGVEKNATNEQIKKSFRKKALKQHPDKGGDPEKFKRLKEAYDTLLDPEKRQLYEEYGEQGVKNGGPPGNQGDIFSMFNQGKKSPKKMKPKLITVQITLDQIYNGCMKQVEIQRRRICGDCQGKGGIDPIKCDQCQGNGYRIQMVQVGHGMYTQVKSPCEKCKASGELFEEEKKCSKCQGNKVVEQQKIIDVAIEPGVSDSHDYIFYGEGDQIPNVLAGDIFVRVSQQKHSIFQRRGSDLVFHREITLLQALTGVTQCIKHLNGKQYIIATAPQEILANKEIKTIKRLGLPVYKDALQFGNLFFEFKVVFPSSGSIDDQSLIAMQKLLNYRRQNHTEHGGEYYILENFNQENLNTRQNGSLQNEEKEEQKNGQQIQCQQQ